MWYVLHDQYKDIASHVNDNTPYIVGKNMWPRNKIQKASVKLFKWFYENGMKANQDKLHFLWSLDISTKFVLPACILKNSGSQKLLGLPIDRNLNCNERITNLFDKATRKVQVLGWIFPYIPQTQKWILMNAYFMSQICYSPLVWIN